ncbi:MAG: TraX family protein [Lachnospiraceae bacterium]
MNNRWKIFSGSQLKLIAMILMLIDHTAYILIEKGIFQSYITAQNYDFWYLTDRIMRGIGRSAFPIFCYFIAEGYLKTHDAGRYLKRLILFAVISEIPFSLASRGVLFAADYRNVYWTLAFGLMALIFYDQYMEQPLIRLTGLLACLLLPVLLHTDYSCYGVLVILLLYRLREQPLQAFLAGWIILMIQSRTEIWAIFGFLLLYLYNGERGKGNKYLFYGFYPLHLLILVLLQPVICPWLAGL